MARAVVQEPVPVPVPVQVRPGVGAGGRVTAKTTATKLRAGAGQGRQGSGGKWISSQQDEWSLAGLPAAQPCLAEASRFALHQTDASIGATHKKGENFGARVSFLFDSARQK